MSYSHAVDGRLAPALQSALQRFAKPWYRLRAIRIFRDDTSLSVTDRLWGSIEQGLRQAEFFLLLASPQAAVSEWVNREVSWWLEHRSPTTLFIALTEGELAWNPAAGGFETTADSPLPPALREVFEEEPRWTDLRFARTADHLALNHPQFGDAVADIAATLHRRPKDELVGEDVRQHRRVRRITRTVVVTLALLVAAATTLGLVARNQRDQAISQRNTALSLALTDAARGQLEHRQDVSLLLGLAAYRLRPDAQAESNILSSLELTRRSGTTGILHGHAGRVWSVSFSPDGRLIASGSGDGTLRLWDSRSHRPLGPPIRAHRGQDVLSVAFSPDGRTLASGGGDGVIRLWAPGPETRYAGALEAGGGAVNTVTISPDGTTLAASDDAGIELWSLVTGRHEGTMQTGSLGTVVTLAFSPNGRSLASGTDQGTIRLWDLATEPQIRNTLRASGSAIRSVAFSPDGRTLASGGDDGRIRLWNASTGARIGQPLAGHDGAVWSVVFSPDGRTLASACDDGLIRLWDVHHERWLGRPLAGHDGAVRTVAFSPDGHTLASGSDDTTIRMWDLRRRLGDPLARQQAPVDTVAFSPDGRTLAAAGDDKTIRLWSVARRMPIRRPLAGHVSAVASIAFSPDGRTLASGSDDGTIRLWRPDARTRSGQVLARRLGAVRGVAFGPRGGLLLSASGDGRTRLFDIAHPRQRAGAMPVAWSIAFGPDGRTIAAGDSVGPIQLWDVVAHRARGHPLTGHVAAVESLAFSPDGRTLASAGDDGTIRLWDVATQTPIVQLGQATLGRGGSGRAPPVHSVAFSSDGRVLASGGENGTIRLWDVADPKRAVEIGQALAGHAGPVYAVAFSPDGRSLASVGDDGTVRLWQGILWSNLDDLQRLVCSIVGTSLSRGEWARYAPGTPYNRGCP